MVTPTEKLSLDGNSLSSKKRGKMRQEFSSDKVPSSQNYRLRQCKSSWIYLFVNSKLLGLSLGKDLLLRSVFPNFENKMNKSIK